MGVKATQAGFPVIEDMLPNNRQTQRQQHVMPRRGFRQRRLLTVLAVAGLAALIGFPRSGESAVYLPPAGSPPTGDVGIPLNISPTLQTKTGDLTFQSGLTIASPTGNPTLTVDGSICWNDPGDRSQCQTTWPAASTPTGSFVKITAPVTDQLGWIDISGSAGSVNPVGLNVRSDVPTTSTSTYALAGQADLTTSNLASFGVYAAAGADLNGNYALYGSAPSTSGWAGYFAGNVAVLSPHDLILGSGGLLDGQSPTTSEICLNGVCRSSWPTISDTYWNVAAGSLEAVNPAWNLAVGGNSSSADFFIEKVASNNSAVLRTDGAGVSTDLTIQ